MLRLYQFFRAMKSSNNEFDKNPVDSYDIYKKLQAVTYTVGVRIKAARINKGLSRKQLGDLIGNYQTICRVEVGVFEQIDTIYEITKHLDLNLSDLFAEPFTYSEKPSYGAICRENKMLKKMLDDKRGKK